MKKGYLVISRKVGERIKIGDDVEVMVSDIDQGKADVAVKAPRHVKIERMPTHVEEAKLMEGKNGNSDQGH